MAREGLTPKQEAFARAYVETGNASEAYRRSYSTGGWSQNAINVQASRLLDNPKIVLWLAARQKKAEDRFDVTLEKLTDMAKDAYDMAKKDDSAFGASAMIKAIAQLSRMHGYDVKERENKRDPFEALDAAQRVHILDAIDRELAGRAGEATTSPASGQA